MDNLTVTPGGPGRAGVQIAEDSRLLSYVVTVPEEVVDRLGLGGVETVDIVRETFKFLLEREPATSIMKSFSIDVVPTYFPEFYEELAARLKG
jgi:bifunctional DNA-binding transcriptional regulator/antitoxin component of YhaV-PrlF toxin-antitoxin module